MSKSWSVSSFKISVMNFTTLAVLGSGLVFAESSYAHRQMNFPRQGPKVVFRPAYTPQGEAARVPIPTWRSTLGLTSPSAGTQPSTSTDGMSCFNGTNYYLPEAEDFNCKNKQKVKVTVAKNQFARICPAAKKQARLQGSIQLTHNGNRYIYRYNGKVEKVPKGCETTTGAAGVCLTPYIHVAADPKFHSMGDIIQVPQLEGTPVPRPDGIGTMPHPGYVVVADVGGAIKGVNRFDFFIGKTEWDSKLNPFGPHGHKMTDPNRCIMAFKKIENGTALASNIHKEIDQLLNRNQSVQLASLGGRQ